MSKCCLHPSHILVPHPCRDSSHSPEVGEALSGPHLGPERLCCVSGAMGSVPGWVQTINAIDHHKLYNQQVLIFTVGIIFLFSYGISNL